MTTPSRKGQPVTQEEKASRAKEVAEILGDYKRWHSHGRSINISTLRSEVKLKIDDYSDDQNLRSKIRSYNDLITEHIGKSGYKFFLHSKNHF